MEQSYHTQRLACHNCTKQMIACRYIIKEENPYCIPCYEQLFSNVCEECRQSIGPDYKDLSFKERHWHEQCFKCCGCQESLVDHSFATKNEKVYCTDCYDNSFAARCDECGQPFRGGMKKFEYRGKQWHNECFLCMECNQPIGTTNFIPRDDKAICIPCHESKYAQRCSKCNEVINKGGISYKNMPWHRECFICINCNKQLGGEKFTSKDEQPYCGDCYEDLFAKRCCSCTKPITGIGGSKFICFEEKHWHSDCFNCYKCQASMVGRGFLMDNEDIMCPDCAQC
uniref:LIM zinc-binding domain-containing protein n=1 Tax=Arion vulgaris TaxID=1028688 RepID=A0A0B7A7B2_9EUPU